METKKDYEVIGEALMPYALDYPYADYIYITVLVPEEEYITQTENESAMYAAIDAKKGEDKQVKEYIDKNILKENDMINVFSVLDMKESFQRYVSKYYMIGSFLVIILAMLVQGYDFDSYRKVFLASDFQLDQMTGSLSNTNFNGITPEIKEILDECPDSAKTGYVYYSEETHKMEPELLKTWEAFADKYEKNWTDYEEQVWEDAKASNTVSVHFLGISESVFDKLACK